MQRGSMHRYVEGEGKKMRFKGGRFLFTLFMAAAVFSISPTSSGPLLSKMAYGQELEKVKMGSIPLISFAANFVAEAKGFNKEQGIEVELINFASAGKMMAPLATGEIEVAGGSPSAGLFNAIYEGADYKVVADKGQATRGHGFSLLVVRKDLVDSGAVKSVKDLKGKKVVFFAKGIVHDFTFGAMAEEVGLTLKDFDITYLEAPKQLLAFENKSIDAAMSVEPWRANAEAKGLAVKFKTPDEVKGLGDVQIAVIMYSGKFIRERRQVAQKYMNAYIKATKYYNERGPQNPEILAMLEKYTRVPAQTIKASIPFYLDNDGKPSVKSISEQQDFFYKNGYIKAKVPMEKVVDLSFLK